MIRVGVRVSAKVSTLVAVVKKTSGMLIPIDPGVNTSRTGGGVSNWNSRPLVRMSTSVAGVPDGELGGAKLPIAKLPLLSGDSSAGTCGLRSGFWLGLESGLRLGKGLVQGLGLGPGLGFELDFGSPPG